MYNFSRTYINLQKILPKNTLITYNDFIDLVCYFYRIRVRFLNINNAKEFAYFAIKFSVV